VPFIASPLSAGTVGAGAFVRLASSADILVSLIIGQAGISGMPVHEALAALGATSMAAGTTLISND